MQCCSELLAKISDFGLILCVSLICLLGLIECVDVCMCGLICCFVSRHFQVLFQSLLVQTHLLLSYSSVFLSFICCRQWLVVAEMLVTFVAATVVIVLLRIKLSLFVAFTVNYKTPLCIAIFRLSQTYNWRDKRAEYMYSTVVFK